MAKLVKIKAVVSKNSRKIRLFSAIIILVIYLVFLIVFTFGTIQDYTDITTSPKPRTFDVPININLSGAKGFIEPQFSIGLTFTYPNGSLFVGDEVNIDGRAVLRNEIVNNISSIAIGFQNCLSYPVSEVYDGIPKQGILQFSHDRFVPDYNRITGEIASVWFGDSVVTWSIEGDYKPIIGIFFNDGKNTTMTVEDITIHVYPKEQLTQMQTNKVATEVAIVAFGFSGLGVISIVVAIFPKNEKDNVEKLCKMMEKYLQAQDKPKQKVQEQKADR